MRALAVGLGAALAVVALVPAGASAHGAPHEVGISLNSYSPPRIQIFVTDIVRWTWEGPDTNHSVTSDPGQAESFDSDPGRTPGLFDHPAGDTFQHTFNRVGTFTYHCKVHPSMEGTIQVVDLPGEAPRLLALAVRPRATCTRPQCLTQRLVVTASKSAILEGRIDRLRQGRWRRVRYVGPSFVRRGTRRLPLNTGGLPSGRYRVVAYLLDNVGRYSQRRRAGFVLR